MSPSPGRPAKASGTPVTNRIRELRFHAGEMTQQALADRVGVSRQTVVAIEQGIRKLIAGRADAYCDIDTFFDEVLHSGEIQGADKVRKLFEIAALPTYPYLYKKHSALAPSLAATIKKMKEEGLLDRYRAEAERGSPGRR